MTAEEFVKRMASLCLSDDEILRRWKGPEWIQIVRRWYIAYPKISRGRSDVNDEVVRLIELYDVEALRARDVRFVSKPGTLGDRLVVGFHDSEVLCVKLEGGELVLCDDVKLTFEIDKVARSGAMFLDAAFLYAEGDEALGKSDNVEQTRLDIANACAAAAGGARYERCWFRLMCCGEFGE